MTAQPSTEFVLDDQLCFAVYGASRAITNAYREGLAQLGLTYTQYVVLLVLWEHDTIAMGELGRRLHLDSATLSPLLSRLEQRDLISRRRSTGDERAVDVVCTPAGRALHDRAREVQADVECATGLTGPELAQLRTDLHRLTQRLHDRAARTDGAAGPKRPHG